MTIALVQTTSHGNAASGTTCAATWGSDTTAGNLLLVFIQSVDGNIVAQPTISSLVDTQGNTYKFVASQADGLNGNSSSVGFLYYAINQNNGTTPTVTVTIASATSPSTVIICREYSGINPRMPFDVKASAGSTSTSAPTSGASAVSDVQNSLVIGLTAWSGGDVTVTAGTGFGNVLDARYTGTGSGASIVAEDQIVSSSSAQTATFSLSGPKPTATIVAVFRGGGMPSFISNRLRPYPFSPGIAR